MNNPRFERNLGLLSSPEQDILANSSVAIAGAGGDGGALAVQLARLGVGELRLADPEIFEIENMNRQATCTEDTLGTNKAVSVADYVRSINPGMSVEVYEDGITQDNTKRFVTGTDLVIDETEYTMHELGVMLAREAREQDIPVETALNIGFGALVTTFRPDGKPLEEFLGLDTEQSIEEIAEQEVSLSRWLPYVPPYADLKVFENVASGEKSAPSVAPGVALAAGLGATQAMLNLVGRDNNRKSPVYAPKALVVDAMTGRSKTVKFGRRSHYLHLLPLVARNLLGRNPTASY